MNLFKYYTKLADKADADGKPLQAAEFRQMAIPHACGQQRRAAWWQFWGSAVETDDLVGAQYSQDFVSSADARK